MFVNLDWKTVATETLQSHLRRVETLWKTNKLLCKITKPGQRFWCSYLTCVIYLYKQTILDHSGCVATALSSSHLLCLWNSRDVYIRYGYFYTQRPKSSITRIEATCILNCSLPPGAEVLRRSRWATKDWQLPCVLDHQQIKYTHIKPFTWNGVCIKEEERFYLMQKKKPHTTR